MNPEKLAINSMRVLAAEGIQKAKSGHPGMALGSAAAAFTLWKHMRHNPADPSWPGRDRFVLSSGHASMLEYTLLHLYGYGVSLEDLQNFRQYGSITPGHPEYGLTPGVEASTGPLGQGFAMAVGMAMAERHMAARYNREGYPVIDNRTYVIMGDGCMMEGVSHEAASLAGHQKLGKLIALYDSNGISIEGSTEVAFTEDVAARFKSYGWQVIEVADGEDTVAMEKALQEADACADRPSLILYHTVIGYGSPRAGTAKVHGEPLGEEGVQGLKDNLGWTYPPFTVPSEVYDYMETIKVEKAEEESGWNSLFEAYSAAYPELKKQWEDDVAGTLPEGFADREDLWAFEGKAATRASSGEVLNRVNALLPNLFGGSADLAPSNKTDLKGEQFNTPDCPEGKMMHYGVRELAMACASNGIALYGGIRPFCATFFVFSDYVKPALRLSALMKLPVLYVLTHDSIGVGEDGPTHEPVEQLAALRAVPGTYVFRPADAREVTAGYLTALTHKGPTALALTRQNLPLLEGSGRGALRGGYVLRDPKGGADVILIGTGSEVEVCFKAADILSVQGYTARIVSMPCMELFEEQDEAYQESVLPRSMRARVAVEAGSSFGWGRYVGLDGETVSIDRFGASGPYSVLFEKFGFTGENVAAAALRVIKALQA